MLQEEQRQQDLLERQLEECVEVGRREGGEDVSEVS